MPRTRSKIASLLVATATLASLITAVGVTSARAAAPACAPQGCWTAPFSPGASAAHPLGKYSDAPPQTPQQSEEYPAAASSVVLPNGRIVYWNGLQHTEDCGQITIAADGGKCAENASSEVVDLTGSSPLFFSVPDTPGGHDDLFCSDQRLLENGSLFDTGGTNWVTEEPMGGTGIDGADGLTELYGSKNTRIFNASTQTWATSNYTMHDGRWYPTLLTLPSGDEFVVGGVTKLLWNSNIMTQVEDAIGNTQYEEATGPLPVNVPTTETWHLDQQSHPGWTLNPAKDNVELPLFARLHLLPDGQIFYSSAGQMWGPAGESVNELDWMNMKLFDPNKIGTADDTGWQNAGMLKYGNMSGAMSVLMPIDPAHPNTAKVLVAGGTVGPAPGLYLATAFSQMITLTRSANGWGTSVADTGDLNNRRWFSSSVLLPNGQVVAFNGADKDEVVLPGSEMPVHQAELFDPASNSWSPLSSDARDRTYHNSAILLPDGSILVGGHAPINQGYGGQGNALPLDALGFVHNLKDPSFERFYPPYLFAGPKPSINASQAHASWGHTLQVEGDPNSPAPIDHFVLSRLPAQTHITDADARTILLGHGERSGNSISLTIPDNRAIVTPGFYYLFGVSDKGVPSDATIIQVADDQYKIGAGSATPVHLAQQAFRSSSNAVTSVHQPVTAKKAAQKSSARTSTPTAVANETAPAATETPSKPVHSSRAAMIVVAAVLGAVLVRRIRTLARSSP